MVYHNIPPVWSRDSAILILGSFPSVKSREAQFFYAHPQNRFWRVLAALLNSPLPLTVGEKTELLLSNGIALWDVAAKCEIKGSSDASLKNVIANDIKSIIDASKIDRVFTNGRAAEKLYERLVFPQTRIRALCLPSTSPSNARFSFETLLKEWAVILP